MSDSIYKGIPEELARIAEEAEERLVQRLGTDTAAALYLPELQLRYRELALALVTAAGIVPHRDLNPATVTNLVRARLDSEVQALITTAETRASNHLRQAEQYIKGVLADRAQQARWALVRGSAE